jgi:hypothetical protein
VNRKWYSPSNKPETEKNIRFTLLRFLFLGLSVKNNCLFLLS